MVLHAAELTAGRGPELAGDLVVARGKLTTALRLITRTLQSPMASAENACSSPVSRPKVSPGK